MADESAEAHRQLGRVVDKSYGCTGGQSGAERVAFLFGRDQQDKTE